MSTELISQKMRKTCDGCGKTTEYEVVGMTEDSPAFADMYQWYVLAKQFWYTEAQQPITVKKEACSLECVPVAAVKLVLPPQLQPQPEEPPLDLAALKNLRVN